MSAHMTFNRDWFVTYTELNDKLPVKIGDGRTLHAIGIGNVKIIARINKKKVQLILKNTLFVPYLKRNLFSFGVATDNGARIICTAERCIVEINDKTIAIGTRTNNNKL